MTIYRINDKKAYVYYNQDRGYWGLPPWNATWDGYDGAPIDNETPSDDPVGEGYSAQEALDNLVSKSGE